MADTAPAEVSKTLTSGFIGQGPKVEEFESQLKDHFNNNRVLTTNSATSAIHLSLLLLTKPSQDFVYDGLGALISGWPGLNPGDQILCSALTCTASNWPVVLDGYRIKWVDIDPLTLNMDLNDLARKITPHTKVIILPFWGGMPVDMYKLKDIQDKAERMYGFRPAVIIDAAHALDSKFDGKHICNFGHITIYSFQAIKHVTCVDGGAVVLPHQDLCDRGKKLRWYGIRRDDNRSDFRCENDISELGTKWHMSDVNATIGIENMKHVNEIVGRHRDNAAYYTKELSGHGGITIVDKAIDVTLLKPTPKSDSSYWIYTIMVERRDEFMRVMKENGIQVSRVHERNDKHSAVAQFRSQLPNLESIIDKMICIPVHHGVTDEDREFIVDTIKNGW